MCCVYIFSKYIWFLVMSLARVWSEGGGARPPRCVAPLHLVQGIMQSHILCVIKALQTLKSSRHGDASIYIRVTGHDAVNTGGRMHLVGEEKKKIAWPRPLDILFRWGSISIINFDLLFPLPNKVVLCLLLMVNEIVKVVEATYLPATGW